METNQHETHEERMEQVYKWRKSVGEFRLLFRAIGRAAMMMYPLFTILWVLGGLAGCDEGRGVDYWGPVQFSWQGFLMFEAFASFATLLLAWGIWQEAGKDVAPGICSDL